MLLIEGFAPKVRAQIRTTNNSRRSAPKKPGGAVGAVMRLRELGLEAFEIGWVRSVRVKEETCALIKEAGADKAVLTIEYLSALERIADGRATKLVIPAEFSGLLGTVAALAEATRAEDDSDEVRPRRGLPIPDSEERVEVPPPAAGLG